MFMALVLAAAITSQTAAIEHVRISMPDGAVLKGWFRDAGANAPAVLFFPMCAPGANDGWVPVADRLKAAGVSSLITTYRGDAGNTNGTGSSEQRWNGADSAAVLAFLRGRVGAQAALATAGASCGVNQALRVASAEPAHVRAVVLFSGPHSDAQLEFVRATPGLAVFSGASAREPPSPDWAHALKAASPNAASRVEILPERAHGTDLFTIKPALAADIADWLAARLKGAAQR